MQWETPFGIRILKDIILLETDRRRDEIYCNISRLILKQMHRNNCYICTAHFPKLSYVLIQRSFFFIFSRLLTFSNDIFRRISVTQGSQLLYWLEKPKRFYALKYETFLRFLVNSFALMIPCLLFFCRSELRKCPVYA